MFNVDAIAVMTIITEVSKKKLRFFTLMLLKIRKVSSIFFIFEYLLISLCLMFFLVLAKNYGPRIMSYSQVLDNFTVAYFLTYFHCDALRRPKTTMSAPRCCTRWTPQVSLTCCTRTRITHTHRGGRREERGEERRERTLEFLIKFMKKLKSAWFSSSESFARIIHTHR